MAAIAMATGGTVLQGDEPQPAAGHLHQGIAAGQPVVRRGEAFPAASCSFRSGPTDKLPRACRPERLRPHHAETVAAGRDADHDAAFADQDFRCWPTGTTAWARRWPSPATPAIRASGRGTGPRQRGGMYAKFWEQVVDWSLRPAESSRLTMTTEYRDGKIQIIVEARDRQEPARHDAEAPRRRHPAQASTAPASAEVRAEEQRPVRGRDQGRGRRLVFHHRPGEPHGQGQGQGRQGAPGRGRSGQRPPGITLPYSPEFCRPGEQHRASWRRSAADGRAGVRGQRPRPGRGARATGAVFRGGLPRVKSLLPLWPWLVLLAGLLLFLDVAARRIAVDMAEVKPVLTRFWARLRGHEVAEAGRVQYLERLQSRRSSRKRSASQPAIRGPNKQRSPLIADASGMSPPPTQAVPPGSTGPPRRWPRKPRAAPMPWNACGKQRGRHWKIVIRNS